MPERLRDFRVWLRGLAAAAITAGANGVLLVAVDPALFSDWERLGRYCGVSALVAVAAYLKQSPLPPGGER